MATQTRTIKIEVQAKGQAELKKISNQMGRLNKEAKHVSKSVDALKIGFASFIGVGAIRSLTSMADKFQLLGDRLTIFAGSAEKGSELLKDLTTSARFTKSSVSDLGTVFNRVGLATQELGLSTDQILGSTIALQQTFRLSGATMAEAAGAAIQLSQGLSSGQLRGQELRSVLESNVVFSSLLSNELGITRGELIKFAESGKITSDVVLNLLGKNFKALNDKAQKLGTTFEQSLTIIIDVFGTKIDEFNKKLGVSKGFAKFANAIVNNIDIVESAIGGLVTLIVLSSIPAIQAAFVSLYATINAHPIVFALSAIASAAIFLARNWDLVTLNMRKAWLKLRVASIKGAAAIVKAIKPLDDRLRKLFGKKPRARSDFFKNEINSITALKKEIALIDKKLAKLDKGKVNTINRIADAMKNLSIKTNGGPGSTADSIASLNAKVREGVITLGEYHAAIDNLKLAELDKKFREGKITLDEYNSGLVDLAQNLEDVNSVSTGAVDGLAKVAKEAGNVAKGVSQGIQSTFSTLGDSIASFVKTGTFEFKKFAESVIDDLTKIIIKAAIIAPLAGGIGSLISPKSPSPSVNPTNSIGFANAGGVGVNASPNFAKGGAFNNGNIIPFATGGIVGSPSLFPLSGGKSGLMGEAGPEAILPLSRGPGGKLGVDASGNTGVVVNVINNTGGEVEQRERRGSNGERVLDVVILGAVRKGIASGSLDNTLGENFGLKRRGR